MAVPVFLTVNADSLAKEARRWLLQCSKLGKSRLRQLMLLANVLLRYFDTPWGFEKPLPI